MDETVEMHPDADRLRAYRLGLLDGDEEDRVEAHVLACTSCARALVGTGDDAFLARVAAAAGVPTPPDLVEPTRTFTPAAPGRARPKAPRGLADFDIGKEVGRGGMGVVYRAHQISLDRDVALKMIRDGALASPAEVERFRREAEAAARLDHPNIVPVFETGEDDGHYYFAMGFVEGTSLADRLRKGPFPPKFAAQAVRIVARAVQFAHEHGVIHRDLKPANILAGIDGRLRVADFGLAKRLDSGQTMTATSEVLGTPQYMPPEQARGSARVGPAADIYSLGATLYALLTGHPPFQAATPIETLRLVLERDPVSPRRLNPAIDRDLETICLKCLEKEPGRRYDSAADLAEDLRLWLAGEPILARPVSRPERLWRWCRRNPKLAGSLLAVAASLLAVATVSYLYMTNRVHWLDRASSAEKKAQAADLAAKTAKGEKEQLKKGQSALDARIKAAEREKTTILKAVEAETARAKSALAERHRQRARTLMERASDSCDRGDIGPGLLTMAEGMRSATQAGDAVLVREIRDQLSARQTQLHPLRLRLEHPRRKAPFDGETPPRHYNVMRAAFSPDGHEIFTLCSPGVVRAWDARDGRLLGEPCGFQSAYSAWCFSPDGRSVLLVGTPYSALSIMKDGKFDTREMFSDTNKPKMNHTIDYGWYHELQGFERFRPSFHPDGSAFLRMGELHDAATGKALFKPRDPLSKVHVVALSPLGDNLLGAKLSEPQVLRTYILSSHGPVGIPIRLHGGTADRFIDTVFSPDGKMVLAMSTDGAGHVWEVHPTGGASRQLGVIRLMTGEQYESAALSPHGAPIAIATRFKGRGVLRHWGADGQPAPVSLDLPGPIRAFAFSPDGERLLVASGSSARLYDVETGRATDSSLVHDGEITDASFSPDGRSVLTAGVEGTAKLWDVGLARPKARSLRRPDEPLQTNAILSPDGTRALLDIWEPHLWDVANGRPVGKPMDVADKINRAIALFSPDGRTLFISLKISTDGLPISRLWDAANGRELLTLGNLRTQVTAAAYRPDGHVIATASTGQDTPGSWILRQWSTADGTAVGVPMSHRSPVDLVAFSPDGKTIWCGSGKTLRRWDAVKCEAVGGDINVGFDARSISFSRDGRVVLVQNLSDGHRAYNTPIYGTVVEAERGRLLKVGGHPLERTTALRPDGRAAFDGERIVRWGNGEAPVTRLRGLEGTETLAFFSPDGATLLTISNEGHLRLWDQATGLPISPRKAHAGGFHVRVSDDFKTMLITCTHHDAMVWDLGSFLEDARRAPVPVARDLTTLAIWVQSETGMELDEEGNPRDLDAKTLGERRGRLAQLMPKK
jgi:WD40 repeat protein